ncbi:FAD-dependent oxidoreductase [Jatrophihabitans sp. DSM 45814]
MKLNVAIIGSGPSGLYAAESLAHRENVDIQVDVIDRLPTPFGLVRYGVAPDHLKIKSILDTLHAVFDRPNVRFLGRLNVGEVLSPEELLRHYDAVVYATGAQTDRHLNVPGENLPGSHSATDFVSWYSGHPLSEGRFDLSNVQSVAVIGAGNVALDVARLIAKHPDELRHTDVPDDVLAALSASSVQNIYIIARRGPVHAKFSTKELRELGELEHATVTVQPSELPPEDADLSSFSRAERANVTVLSKWANAERPAAPRRIQLRFWRSPAEILGDESVTGLRLRDMSDQARANGSDDALEEIPAELVIRAIGYRSVPLAGLPFDQDAGVVPNDRGRMLDESGAVRRREYVTGWLKRGPTGVIGTNKSDSEETVNSIVEDLVTEGNLTQSDAKEPIDEFLQRNEIPYTEFDGWLRIDGAEREAGRIRGGARVKIADWETLLRLAQRQT